MEINIGQSFDSQNLQQGIARLSTEFDEDELIILKRNDPATSDFISFNGDCLLTNDHVQLRNGQPIYSKMAMGRFGTSPIYINELTLQNNIISFSILLSEDYLIPRQLTLSYFIVEKSANPENNHRIIAESNTSISPGDITYSFTIQENITVPDYKAVVVLHSSTINEFLQAASTDRPSKPFRIATEGPMSMVGTTFVYAPAVFEKFYIMNLDFNATYLLDLIIRLEVDTMPQQWGADFCGNGLCITDGYYEMELEAGDYVDFYSSVFAIQEEGFAAYKITIEADDHTVAIPHYYGTKNVDVLVIQDTGAERLDDIMLNVLRNTELSFSLFYPNYGSIDLADISHINTIIWNVPTIYPAFPNDKIGDLGNLVSNSKKLLVMGQYIAQTLTNNTITSYNNLNTLLFMTNTLAATYSTGTGGPVMIGHGFMESINFVLNDTWTEGNIITPIINNNVLFIDDTPAQNKMGVYNQILNGQSTLLTFDLHNITENTVRQNIINNTLTWFGSVDNKDHIEEIVKQYTINIYPNPAISNINIEYYRNKLQVNNKQPIYSIYNIKGQKIHSEKLQSSKKGFSKNLDLSKLSIASGMYFIKINDGDIETVCKTMILK